jgi:hypothetical protein
MLNFGGKTGLQLCPPSPLKNGRGIKIAVDIGTIDNIEILFFTVSVVPIFTSYT